MLINWHEFLQMSMYKSDIKTNIKNTLDGIEEAVIRGIYFALLQREPDCAGLQYWVARIKAGESLDEVVKAISTGDEHNKFKGQNYDNKSFNELCHKVLKWVKSEQANSQLTILDVSAQTLAHNKQFYEHLNQLQFPHNVYKFEPVEHGRHEQASETSKVTVLRDFVGDGCERDFYLNEPDCFSSFMPFNASAKNRLESFKYFATLDVNRVTTRTLDDVVGKIENIDLLKLDDQDCEFILLKHSIQTLQRTQVVHCDVSFIEMYQGQARFGEIDEFLTNQGFDLVDFQSLTYFSPVETHFSWSKDLLGRGEAVYFRHLDNTMPSESIISQCLLALIIYKKPSFAAWLAKHLEEKHPLRQIFFELGKNNKSTI